VASVFPTKAREQRGRGRPRVYSAPKHGRRAAHDSGYEGVEIDLHFHRSQAAAAQALTVAPRTTAAHATMAKAWATFVHGCEPPMQSPVALRDFVAYAVWLSMTVGRLSSIGAVAAYTARACTLCTEAGISSVPVRQVYHAVLRGVSVLAQSGRNARPPGTQPRLNEADFTKILPFVLRSRSERSAICFAAFLLMYSTTLRVGSLVETAASRAEPWRLLDARSVAVEDDRITIKASSWKRNRSGEWRAYVVSDKASDPLALRAVAAVQRWLSIRDAAATARQRELLRAGPWLVFANGRPLTDAILREWASSQGWASSTHQARRGGIERVYKSSLAAAPHMRSIAAVKAASNIRSQAFIGYLTPESATEVGFLQEGAGMTSNGVRR